MIDFVSLKISFYAFYFYGFEVIVQIPVISNTKSVNPLYLAICSDTINKLIVMPHFCAIGEQTDDLFRDDKRSINMKGKMT